MFDAFDVLYLTYQRDIGLTSNLNKPHIVHTKVTLRCVRATTTAVQKQVLHALCVCVCVCVCLCVCVCVCVCVCNLSYPACKVHCP